MECGTMTAASPTRSRPRRWTYADYLRIPADGKRHELIDGRHFVSPAPDYDHQSVVLEIARRLGEQIQDRGQGIVMVAPLDVHLPPCTVLQPDVMAMRGVPDDLRGKKKLTKAPELVVEVLSPSTAARDRSLKRRRYAAAGVLEYWLVDPVARTIEQCGLENGELVTLVEGARSVKSIAFPGVRVALRSR